MFISISSFFHLFIVMLVVGIIYGLYTLIRAYQYFSYGIKDTFSIKHTIHLYHILWMVIDIPAMVLGKLYHVLKFFFNIPVIPLKRDRKINK